MSNSVLMDHFILQVWCLTNQSIIDFFILNIKYNKIYDRAWDQQKF